MKILIFGAWKRVHLIKFSVDVYNGATSNLKDTEVEAVRLARSTVLHGNPNFWLIGLESLRILRISAQKLLMDFEPKTLKTLDFFQLSFPFLTVFFGCIL